MKLKQWMCTVLLWALAFVGARAADTFTNPVIFSDVPDPDVIRVGSDYYMVSTTMHLSPGCPVMKSKDLVHWKTVSYVFDTLHESPKNDLLGGDVYGRGQWAASIRYKDGEYFVFFGTSVHSYLYSAKDPAGPWQLRATLPQYMHDASLLFDDDGRAYLASGSSHIRIVEFKKDLSGIDPDGLNVEVIPGEPAGLLEGTHFYKINGKYYLSLIWWPQGGIRTQLCFRSDSIAGPYERKVILHDDLGWAGHGVAQGGFVDTPDGRWYAMLFQDHDAVGRVPVLMPCHWTDGWPMLGDADGKVPHEMEVPVQGCKDAVTVVTVSDDFDETRLPLEWQWNHNPDNSLWSLTERKGWLRLRTGQPVTDIFAARNTLSQRTVGPQCSGEAALDLTHMKDGDHAGLSAYCSDPGCLEVVMEEGKKYLLMTDRRVEKARVPLSGNRVCLRMDCDFTTDTALFYYSTDGKRWSALGTPFHMVYTLKHFMGNRFAIFNYATKEAGGYVDVDYFHFVQGSRSGK